MYNLSAPKTSRKPSLELSLPRRRGAPAGCGIGRGECSGSWPTTPDRPDVAADAIPLGADADADGWVVCLFGCWEAVVVEREDGGC